MKFYRVTMLSDAWKWFTNHPSTYLSGYFAVDPDSTSEKLVFNRTVTLRDSYAKGGNK